MRVPRWSDAINWMVGRDRMRTPSSWPPLTASVRNADSPKRWTPRLRRLNRCPEPPKHRSACWAGLTPGRSGRPCAKRPLLSAGSEKAAVVHAERLEDALIEERRKALAGGRFDHASEQVAREAVFPVGAGLMREGRGGELFIELRGCERAGIEVAHRGQIEPTLGVTHPSPARSR